MGSSTSISRPSRRIIWVLATVVLSAVMVSGTIALPAIAATKTRLVTGLAGGSGSTVGPDGALYVTEGLAGRVSRVDPRTGAITTYASGLPPAIIGIGGAADVVFKGGTAYVLVTLVGADVGGSDVVGVYRVDDPTHFTVIADIGAFALAHPPATDFVIPTGLQYAIENVRDGFLVTDGHHNRIYRVTLDGTVTERITFGNIVPTGLEFRDGKVYVAQAGPVPHLPRYGRILKFRVGSNHVTEVARGGRLLVDVEYGAGHPLRPVPGLLHARPGAGFARGPEHRQAPQGHRRRVHRGGVASEPTDLARDHREERLRRHPGRRGLEDPPG